VLFRKGDEAALSLARPTTIPTQTGSADLPQKLEHSISEYINTQQTHLATRMVPKVIPMHLELGMVVHMNQLVNQRVLHVGFGQETVLAEQDAGFGAKTAGSSRVTGTAVDVVCANVCAFEC
jgi:hypothetical protein